MKTKKELRSEILKARRKMDPEEAGRLSRLICARVRETVQYRQAASLCVYMPINNEVGADLLIREAEDEGRRVYIPKVTGDEMVFTRYEEGLVREEGPFRIRESASADVLEPDGSTLIIMPGSVFDLSAHRIGYGGGYYDKYLSRYPMCRTLALCFDFQIVEELPAEEHDICPEMIISEKRIICRRG